MLVWRRSLWLLIHCEVKWCTMKDAKGWHQVRCKFLEEKNLIFIILQDKLKNCFAKVVKVHWDLELFSLKQLSSFELSSGVKLRDEFEDFVSDCVWVNDGNIFYASSICQILPLTRGWTNLWWKSSIYRRIYTIIDFNVITLHYFLFLLSSSHHQT